jgi:F-type H+-transporting ATPase subunit epsilon
MVGRLGFGILKIRTGVSVVEWFVDGGFVQVTREGVNILTDSLLKPSEIDRKQAESDLDRAMAIKSTTPETAALKERSLAQARAKVRLGS